MSRFEPWLEREEEGDKCMLNSDVSDHDININFYSCKEEEEIFKESDFIERIPLTNKYRLIIQKGIYKHAHKLLLIGRGQDFFVEGVYNNLQVLEVFGEPWTDESVEKFQDEVFEMQIKDSKKFGERVMHPDEVESIARETKFRRILIRVSGKGSRYCHHINKEHKHYPIYFELIRQDVELAILYQRCFCNKSFPQTKEKSCKSLETKLICTSEFYRYLFGNNGNQRINIHFKISTICLLM
jgi:hypothetical protein